MKKTILALLAVGTMVACKKNETTTANDSADSTSMSAPADTGMATTGSDSASAMNQNNAAASTNLSDQDKKFVDAAAKGGMMEVMMGELAKTNAQNAAVKSLGDMMVTDHGKANEELKSWASMAKYTLPSSLDADQQKKYDELKAKKGADFDRAYTDLMVSDHKMDIAEFKKEASGGMDASVKSFASKTLPTLEHHLMESEKAKAAVK